MLEIIAKRAQIMELNVFAERVFTWERMMKFGTS